MAETPAQGRAEDLAREVFARRAATYVTSASHTDRETLARLVERARPEPGWTTLDVATGAGHAAFAIAPHVHGVVATDLTPGMLEEARKLGETRGVRNVEFQVADVHALPFHDGRFDLVTSRRAPHHFSDIRKALREIRRVLRHGGRLVIDDRSAPEDDAADDILDRLDRLHDPSHVRQYRPSAWRRLLEEAGFKVELIEPFSQLRPLEHLKGDVAPADCARIDAIATGLDARLRKVLGVEERGGEIHHLHFFVLIAARRT